MFRKIALAACLLSASVLSANAEPLKYEVSQVAATSSFAFLPVYVAEHMGYFQEEGVNLKTVFVASSQAGLAMVANGDGAYYLSTPVAGARAAAQGARITNCGGLMTENPTAIVISAAVAKKHGVTDASRLSMDQRIALLKGLRLAAHTPGSSPDLALKYVLKRAGLDPERDAHILPITDAAILAALDRGRIDGFAFSSPHADAAVLQYGAVKLVTMSAGEYQLLAGQLSVSLACNKDWVEKQPDAAAAVLRAIWRGMTLMKTDPEKARAAARKALPTLDEAVFNSAFDFNVRAFPDSPRITRQQMGGALDYHVKTGGTPISVKVEDTFTNAAVDRAAKGMK